MESVVYNIGRKVSISVKGNLVYIGEIKKTLEVDNEDGVLIQLSKITGIHIWIPIKNVISIDIIE